MDVFLYIAKGQADLVKVTNSDLFNRNLDYKRL